MRKGEAVRRFVICVAVLLLVTGQWAMLLFGAVWYHLARVAVAALERRFEGTGRSQVTHAQVT